MLRWSSARKTQAPGAFQWQTKSRPTQSRWQKAGKIAFKERIDSQRWQEEISTKSLVALDWNRYGSPPWLLEECSLPYMTYYLSDLAAAMALPWELKMAMRELFDPAPSILMELARLVHYAHTEICTSDEVMCPRLFH